MHLLARISLLFVVATLAAGCASPHSSGPQTLTPEQHLRRARGYRVLGAISAVAAGTGGIAGTTALASAAVSDAKVDAPIVIPVLVLSGLALLDAAVSFRRARFHEREFQRRSLLPTDPASSPKRPSPDTNEPHSSSSDATPADP